MQTIPQRIKNVIDYTTFIIDIFAQESKLSMKEAHNYLRTYGGLSFLRTHYEVEHCENPEYTLQALKKICQRNGGRLAV